MENGAYVVKNGIVHKIENPKSGHGKQIVVWQNGNIIDIVTEERKRI